MAVTVTAMERSNVDVTCSTGDDVWMEAIPRDCSSLLTHRAAQAVALQELAQPLGDLLGIIRIYKKATFAVPHEVRHPAAIRGNYRHASGHCFLDPQR